MNNPNEVRTFEKGKVELVNFPDKGITIGRGPLSLDLVGKNVLSQL